MSDMEKSSRSGGAWRKIFVVLLVLFLLLGGVGAWQYLDYRLYMSRPDPVLKAAIEMEIKPGMNFNEVAEKLLMERVISNRTWFSTYARSRGLTTQVQAGVYQFRPGLSPLQVLDMITRGEVTTVTLAVPEGYTIFDIARRVGSLGPWSEEAFIKAATDHEAAKLAGSPLPTLEGYLFPAVYDLKMSMSESDIVEMMVKRGKREMTPARVSAAGSAGFSWHQVLTLASLIQKEAARREEMATIASVFVNRLNKSVPMPLQCDPTVVYGIRDFEGPIKKTDLLRPSPYNTYLNLGLPPGPICNPGVDAIEAALNPAQTDYLYFVAEGPTGRHAFASTYRDHLKNVNAYRKHLRGQGDDG